MSTSSRPGRLFRATMHRSAAELPVEGTMPALDGATGWLNSPPLTAAELRGKVVLVDFWTYTCINWLRTLPYVRAWAEKYARRTGSWCIGVHTPEFDVRARPRATSAAPSSGLRGRLPGRGRQRLRGLARVRQPLLAGALLRRRAGTDPAPPLRRGRVRAVRDGPPAAAGRGRSDSDLDHELVTVDADGVEAPADWDNLRSPESYLGYERADSVRLARRRALGRPARLHRARAAAAQRLGARRHLDGGAARRGSTSPTGAIAYRFQARDVHLVLGPAAGGTAVPFRVRLDGEPPGAAHGTDVDDRGRRHARPSRGSTS